MIRAPYSLTGQVAPLARSSQQQQQSKQRDVQVPVSSLRLPMHLPRESLSMDGGNGASLRIVIRKGHMARLQVYSRFGSKNSSKDRLIEDRDVQCTDYDSCCVRIDRIHHGNAVRIVLSSGEFSETSELKFAEDGASLMQARITAQYLTVSSSDRKFMCVRVRVRVD